MSLFNVFKSTAPSREEYLKLFLAVLANRGVTPTVVDEADFFLRMPAGNSVYLENGHAEYSKARPAERPAILQRYALSALANHAMGATYAEAESTLLPVLRANTYASLIALGLHAKDPGTKEHAAAVNFAPGLILAIVRDTPETMMFVKRSTLAEWGVTEEQALLTALANLRDGTAKLDFEEQAPGLLHATWPDGYSTSRVALTEIFQHLPIDGDPVFFAPHRDHLWVTGHRDVFNQAHMLKLGEPLHFEAYPLSPNLYRLAGDAWELYEPEDPIVANTLRALQQRRTNSDYRQQKELLDAVFERDGTDIFVASHSLYNGPAGDSFSLCVWTRGADSLLPVTDRVLFLLDAKTAERIILPWHAAAGLLGDLLELDPSYVPARYRVRTFPAPALLLQLQELERQLA